MTHPTAPQPSAVPVPTVLILEDECMTALDLEDICQSLGYRVVGPFAHLSTARAALQGATPPDHALLDVDVLDGQSYGLASDLEDQGVDVTFVTAQAREVLKRLPDATVIDKPFSARQLEMCLPPSLLILTDRPVH